MLRSMTGYGRVIIDDAEVAQVWEVRSVNNRHLDIKWRLPNLVRAWETRLEKVVRQYARRGRLDINLTLTLADSGSLTGFDDQQANAMLDTLVDFAASRGDNFEVDYNTLLRVPFLWEGNQVDVDDSLIEVLCQGLDLALKDWDTSRQREAQNLAQDLNNRADLMEEWVKDIAERAPEIKEERLQSVRDRLTEVLARLDADLDESRFLHEAVVLADKLDVSEEITRLSSHLLRIKELLKSGKEAGKRLDFTLQEAFREITTCGNKVQDVQISLLIVDFKNELEKCREQVQNLE